MPLPNRSAFLSACLMLAALLCTLPVLADAPAVPNESTAQAQLLPLQNTVPGDILKALHWDTTFQRFDSTAQVRIEGVTQITAQPATNSLSVVASPAGFAKVRDLVRILDVAPIPVQIKFALANATDTDLKGSGINFDLVPYPDLGPAAFLRYSTGKDVASFLQTLTKQGAVTQQPVITTANNVAASLHLTTTAHSQLVSSTTLAVTPCVNSDNSVTLALHPIFQDGTVKREIKTLRTVRSGETMVIVMPPVPSTMARKNLLLFVTPTIVGNPFHSAGP